MTDFYRMTPREQEQAMVDLARTALVRWGIHPTGIALLKMRENAVFRVDYGSGHRHALRIHRHGYHSDAALQSELQWMRALEESGVPVPQVIPSAAGRLFETVAAAAVPEPRQVDLFDWIEGRPLGASGESLDGDQAAIRRVFRSIGELCALVHNQSAAWNPPSGFRRHAWDAEGLTGETPLWGRFWELKALTDAERSLIERARRRVHEELSALDRSPEHYSLIHADLTPENLMVHGGDVRLIDFDDAGFGWHLFEIATTLFFHIGLPYFDSAYEGIIEGYRAQRELSDETLARLPLFILARSFTYLGWVHTRSETETARELTPMLVEAVCSEARNYLGSET
jgi:Ser/Thr protein kinase RdoA (MazF antagonist)